MVTLRIYDVDHRRTLAVELRHLLELLAPRFYQADWKVSTIRSSGHEWFEATGRGGEQLEKQTKTASTLSGPALTALATETHQVIWGAFTGSFPKANDTAWVTIRFIDSTYCEVDTSDERVIDRIKSFYRDVRDADT